MIMSEKRQVAFSQYLKMNKRYFAKNTALFSMAFILIAVIPYSLISVLCLLLLFAQVSFGAVALLDGASIAAHYIASRAMSTRSSPQHLQAGKPYPATGAPDRGDKEGDTGAATGESATNKLLCCR